MQQIIKDRLNEKYRLHYSDYTKCFFMSQYFNKKYSKDKKQLFLVIGILVLFINFIRYMTS